MVGKIPKIMPRTALRARMMHFGLNETAAQELVERHDPRHLEVIQTGLSLPIEETQSREIVREVTAKPKSDVWFFEAVKALVHGASYGTPAERRQRTVALARLAVNSARTPNRPGHAGPVLDHLQFVIQNPSGFVNAVREAQKARPKRSTAGLIRKQIVKNIPKHDLSIGKIFQEKIRMAFKR